MWHFKKLKLECWDFRKIKFKNGENKKYFEKGIKKKIKFGIFGNFEKWYFKD